MTDERITKLIYIRDECDHCIMKPSFVLECGRIFGCTLKPRKIDGWFMSPERDDDCEGLPADEIVENICNQLHVPYEMKYGRGSQLRECCAKLITFFTSSPDAPPPRAKSVWPGALRSQKKI